MNTVLVLKRFKEMGLSSYEAKSYLSLLERDTLTVAEVSRIAEIPRANAYEALEKLMAKGMCISKPGDTKKYSASDPSLIQDKFLMEANQAMEIELENLNKKEDEVLEKYKVAKEAELLNLSEKEKEILEKNRIAKENITDMIKELAPLYKDSRANENPLEYIQIIKDPYQIHRRFMQLCSEAKKEILVFFKPPFSGSHERIEQQQDQQAKLLKKGVVIKSIYEIPEDENEMKWRSRLMESAIKQGEQTRVIKELPMKMAIFDERIVLNLLEDPVMKKISVTTLVIEHRSLAKTLKIVFNTFWEQAEDYHVLKN